MIPQPYFGDTLLDSSTLRKQFEAIFGPGGTLIEVRAPGRVNLIGEHTDYNDGFVCPMAIDKTTAIICHKRSDSLVRIHSNTAKAATEFHLDHAISKEQVPPWSLYPRGVAEALRQRNLVPSGMDAYADSTVPIGGGLSSSASFEVATALALLTINKTSLDPVEMALACQWAEHNYPGMPCGIMDQFISALGQKGHALLLDCRDRSTKQVPLDDPNLRVVIANSNVKHELVSGEYTARRHQCEAAVKWLAKRNPEVHSLRDATLNMLEDGCLGMNPAAYRRAHHVITEIARTTDFATALEKHDYATCGQLMYASHASLRDDYAVSCQELDDLVEIARTVPGVYGARMTGGGFGGSTVTLCESRQASEIAATLSNQYAKATGITPQIFASRPSQGAHLVK